MLDHIHVQGFQSLRAVDIDLGRFTVILGESGTGKSAFIRSVLKMVRNDAVSGTSGGETWSHLPPSTANAEVELSVDAHKVRWVKGRDNKYVVDGAPLLKVGKGCPDEVQDVLKMRELSFDGADKYHLNFSQQFDMPFLLDDSGSKVAKILGEITNVNILYAANRQANSMKATATRTLTVRSDDLAAQTELLKEFTTLPAKRQLLAEVLALQEALLVKVDRYKQLFSYSTRIARLSELTADSALRLNALQELPQAAARVSTLFETLTTYRALVELGLALGVCRTTAQRLGGLAKRLNPLRTVALDELDASLARYADMRMALVGLGSSESAVRELGVALAEVRPVTKVNTAALDENLSRYRELEVRLQKLETVQRLTAAAGSSYATAAFELKHAEAAYDEFVLENPTCPFCGAPLDATHTEAHA